MTTNCTDLVSVILPAYNAERYIGSAIKSVLRQTYPYFEIIVVDDGSTDKTAEVVRQFKDKRIHLIQHPENKGVSAARNTAMKHAKGKWFAILDADDEQLPERIEKLMKILFESGNNYFIGDDQLICFDTSSGLKQRGSAFKLGHLNIGFNGKEIAELSLIDFLKAGSPAVHMIFPAVPVKRHGLQYKIELQHSEDFEFYCQLFRIGLKLKLYKEPLYLYRLTPGSLSGSPDNVWGRVKALKLLSSDERFTPKERNLFKEKIRKEEKRALYREFTYMLKRGEFSKANQLLFKHPSLFIKLLYSLPHSLRYRIAAKKAGGRIK